MAQYLQRLVESGRRIEDLDVVRVYLEARGNMVKL
jgi:hypothetical protein